MAAAHTFDDRLEVKASAFAFPQCDAGHAAARRDLGIMITTDVSPVNYARRSPLLTTAFVFCLNGYAEAQAFPALPKVRSVGFGS
jgi:hypothetical protein